MFYNNAIMMPPRQVKVGDRVLSVDGTHVVTKGQVRMRMHAHVLNSNQYSSELDELLLHDTPGKRD